MIPGEWVREAACRGVGDLEMFFPDTAAEARKAKQFCFSCPVQQQCLQYALKSQASSYGHAGIWGGTDERERNKILKRMKTL
jgi:WhiB family redox-sensing transcriptional regulator